MLRYWRHDAIGNMYYSGDVVSQDSTGAYYFAGRIDRQIKFRGYRVQPEEIESVVTSFMGVKDAAVTSNETDLTAYISVNDSTISDASILSFCQQQLESYMIPSRIVRLDEIPRSQRGKIDYNYLSQLGVSSC